MISVAMSWIKRNLLRSALLISFSILLSCASTQSWKTAIAWKDFSFNALPTARDYPDEGAVVLLDAGDAEIFKSGEFSFTVLERHTIIKIFDERGFVFTNVTIPYSSASEISNLQARTISPDGKIVPLPENQVYDVTLYPGFIFYSDVRAKRFALPAVEKGCVVEYRWRTTVRNFTYRDRWTFQNEVPTLISRYHLKAPAEWEVKWKTIGIDLQPEIVKVPAGFKQDYFWQAKNLAPLIAEPGMPPSQRVMASLILSPIGMSRWNDIARWYRELISDRIKADKSIKEKAVELTKECKSEREKLAAIYNFVRDHVRYVAIAIGIGGYQPHFAEEIYANRYGDCKDKVTLIMAMASAVGLTVEPVIISTWQNGDVDTSIVSHTHFNHLIARAILSDSTNVWMDATESYCPFGKLPWYDQDRQVLSVNSHGEGEWLTTPSAGSEENVIQRTWKLRIDSSGICHGRQSMLLAGAAGMEAREEIHSMREGELQRWVHSPLLARFPQAHFKPVELKNRMRLDQPLQFSCDFRWSLANTDSNIAFPLSLEKFSQFDWQKLFVEKERKFPLLFRYPIRIIDSLSVEVDGDWSLLAKSECDSLSTKIGRFAISSAWSSANTFRLVRRLQIEKTEVPPEDYRGLWQFINAVAMKDQSTTLLLTSKR